MNYDLIGIGNALVDIQAQVEDDLLKELGFQKGGMTLTTAEEQKVLLEKLKHHSLSISSGGSAANTIHGLGALGGKSYYIGKVAGDEYGNHYTKDMADCGVGFTGPDAAETGTGTSVVLITPDAERSMVTHLGISTSLNKENVDESIIKNSNYVYIEGYLFTEQEPKEAAKKTAHIAKKQGLPVAFTLSDAFVVNMVHDEIVEFIQWNVDILFCNDEEAKALAKTTDTSEAFNIIQGYTDTLFLTRGSSGAWAGKKGQDKISVGAFPVKALDTTGAGDLFASGAMYGLAHKHGLEESAILGGYCASQVIAHLGARLPSHSHRSVKKVLEEYHEKVKS